jgi:hypothetical protein
MRSSRSTSKRTMGWGRRKWRRRKKRRRMRRRGE